MTDSINVAISANVLATRQEREATREEMASACRALGAPATFTAAALRNLETGRRPPSVDELVWLATALHVPVRGLLGEHADLWGGDDGDVPPGCGAVEAATRRAVAGLPGLDGHQLALAESAYALARQLDDGAGMAAAAVGRELRATLKDIWDGVDDDDDDDEDLGPS